MSMMQEDGEQTGRFKVRSLMRELELVSKQPGSHAYKQATVERPDIPNILNRESDVPAPNLVWCGVVWRHHLHLGSREMALPGCGYGSLRAPSGGLGAVEQASLGHTQRRTIWRKGACVSRWDIGLQMWSCLSLLAKI